MVSNVSKMRSKKHRDQIRGESFRKLGRSRPGPALLFALLFWGTALALLNFSETHQFALLNEGQESPITVISTHRFQCVDVAQTELDRRKAAANIPPIFSINAQKLSSAQRVLNKLFSNALELQLSEEGQVQRLAELQNILDLLNVSPRMQSIFTEIPADQLGALREHIEKALTEVTSQGIIAAEDRRTAFNTLAAKGRISLKDATTQNLHTVPINALLLPDQAQQAIVSSIMAENPTLNATARTALLDLVSPWASPNLVYDKADTEMRRKEAAERVEPATAWITSGSTLVEEDEVLTTAILAKLHAWEAYTKAEQSTRDRLREIGADALILLAGLIAVIGLLSLTRAQSYPPSKLLLMLILFLITVLISKSFLTLTVNSTWLTPTLLLTLIPIGMTVLLATILIDAPSALALGFWTSLTASLLLGHNYIFLLNGLVVTIVGTRSCRGIHRRSRMIKAGLSIAAAQIICWGALCLTQGQSFEIFSLQAFAGLINGLICAFLTLLLLPLLEWLFKITTDITLLELCDMGNPLLQRLAMEAPGTYHHSMVVANLASSAAEKIHANALMVRVGAYFHDIGKLTKPNFFIENSSVKNNPHDELSPNMSTLVITSHVKEGVALARSHKLPQLVIDAIEQHHGTGVISYFYHMAMQQENAQGDNPDTRVAPADFRYPGPKPQSKEMAILCLADPVEAASRAIEKPTASRIENLITDLFQKKIKDGQLDECPLTLAELATLRNSFVFTLTNMLHGRIPYPDDDESGNKRSAEPVRTERGRTTELSGSAASNHAKK